MKERKEWIYVRRRLDGRILDLTHNVLMKDGFDDPFVRNQQREARREIETHEETKRALRVGFDLRSTIQRLESSNHVYRKGVWIS